jgi:phosphatidylglycerophosphatase C
MSDKDKTHIAAFDFDGTLVFRNTLIDFIFFTFGFWKTVLRFIPLLPGLLRYKLGKISNEEAKTRLFGIFFKDMSAEVFNGLCKKYAQRLEVYLNPEAIQKVRWHQQQGHEVLIVSASIDNWIYPLAELHNIKIVLGTKAEFKEEKLTGKFSTKNCYGPEKANRILQHYPNLHEYELWAYGDTVGDREMLELAQHPYYKTF